MSLPTTQKQWLVQGSDKGFDGLVYQDAPVPSVGDNDILVRLRGASLNYRDLIIPRGQYPSRCACPSSRARTAPARWSPSGPR
jgi:NADPH:quinone reductase-like Zn-dependent oxidoreductase